MKFKFGPKSSKELETCHRDLRFLARYILNLGILDISVIEGHRAKLKQDNFYYSTPQRSKVKFPDGKHNSQPSEALDIVPFINGEASWNKLHCCVLAGIVLTAAKHLGINIRWGGNWDMDSEPITDQDFQDLAHYELVGDMSYE